MKKLRELTAFFNKQYQDQPDGKFLLLLQKAFLAKLEEFYKGQIPEHIFFGDDLFVLYRNLGFLSDESFVTAWKKVITDEVIRGRIWRVWILCWTMYQASKQNGVVLDLGCYNGQAFAVALSYTLSKRSDFKSRVVVSDLFANPPLESRKSGHSEKLHLEVERLLNDIYPTKVIKGELPGSLTGEALDKIIWCQIDLNSAAADLESLRFVWDRVQPGGYIVLDDYGFSRYGKTKMAIDAFCELKNEIPLELPTGQGLIIKTN